MQRKWLIGGVAALGAGAAALAAAAVLVVVAAIAVVVGLPLAAKPRLTAWLDEQLDQAFSADVSFSDVDVSLLSSFPRLGLRVHDLSVVNRAPFEGVELLHCDEVALAVDLASALTGDRIRIRRIALVAPALRLAVDGKGRSNADAFLGSGDPSGPSAGPGVAVRLDDLRVQDLSLRLDDRAHKLRVRLRDLDLHAKADFDGDLARVRTDVAAAGLTVRKGRIEWLREAKIDADVALDYALSTGEATFGENTVALNAMPLHFEGSVAPARKATAVDLAFRTEDTSFKSLLSLVPSAFDDSFAGVEATGTVAVGGTVTGKLASSDRLPAFDVAVTVTDGHFRYPDLPSAVDDVQLDLTLAHPGNGPLDDVVVDIPHLALRTAGAPFEARAHVETPTSDPDVKAKLTGRIDLAALRSALPAAADAPPATGSLDVDLDVAGKMSDFQAGRVDRVHADGTVRGRDIVYASEGWPDLRVRELDLALGADSAELRQAAVTWTGPDGASDLAVRGKVEGILPYLMADGVLGGKVAVTSQRMDLRPFEGAGEADEPAPPKGKSKGKAGKAPAAPKAPGAPMLVAVPERLDLRTALDVGALVTSSFEMTDVTGTVRVRDQAVEMDPLKAHLLGGGVTLAGRYAAPTASRADVDLTITAAQLDLGRTIATFATLRELVPVLEGAVGQFDSGFTVQMALGPDGWPDLATLASSGLFAPGGTTVRPAVLSSLRNSLGSDGFGSVTVAGTRIQYALTDGQLALRPFTVDLGPAPATLRGTVGVLDHALDLKATVAIPSRLLSGSPLLASLKQGAGKELDVKLDITGTTSKPKVGVSLEGTDAVDAIAGAVDDLLGGDDGKGKAKAGKGKAKAKAK
ncbi:MAG: AsmA-like C-terminal region-containing protein [Myxococcota bacterium]